MQTSSDPSDPDTLQERGAAYSCSNSGYFELSFDNNFTQPEQDVACAVFEYLSGVVLNTGNQTIYIDFVKEVPASGAGAEAEVIYLDYTNSAIFPCGIMAPKIWKRIVLGYDLPDFNFGYDGKITINPNIDWFAGSDPMYIEVDEADLYSTILHEAMHLLGFASLIGDDGAPLLFGRYSLWDTYLSGTGDNTGNVIIPQTSDPDCCNEYVFNSAVFSSLPTDLFNDGCSDVPPDSEIWFDGTVPVSSEDANGGDVSIYLSHIDEDCAGEDYYVMNAELLTGETKRFITDDEEQILTTLGYSINMAGSKICYAEARDEIVVFLVPIGETIEIPFSFLLSNDFLTADVGDYEIEFLPCEDDYTDFVSVTASNSAFLVTGIAIDLDVASGIHAIDLCYTIKCVEGGIFCGQANFDVLVVGDFPDISECVQDCADIACLGKFERYTPGTGAYLAQSQTGNFSILSPNNSLNASNTHTIAFSTDVSGDNPNDFLYLHGGGINPQGINLPLDEPIAIGETVRIVFHAATRDANNSTYLQLYGSSAPPCPIISEPGSNCTGDGLEQCQVSPGSYTTHCIDGNIPITGDADALSLVAYGSPVYPYAQNNGLIPYWLNSGIDWDDPIEICWTNNTNEPINHILIYETASFFGQLIIIDDIVVQKIPLSSAGFDFEETDGCTVQFTSDPAVAGCAEFVHSWDFDGLGNSSDADPEFEFPAAGSYTVTHEVCLEGGCGCQTFELTITIDCLPDVDLVCACSSGYNLGSMDANSTVYLSALSVPADVTGGCVAIGGKLIVDEDWKLDGVTVQMQPGSEIVTLGESDVLFEIYNSTIESCQKMWKGITIDINAMNGESAVFKFKDNYIRDAQYAVHTKGKSTILIKGNHFERNFVGCFFESNGASPAISDKLIGNYFTTTTTGLKMPYDGQSPDPGTNTFAGIYAKDTPFLIIGDPGSATGVNYFTNLRNGIFAENSGIRAYYTDMSDIKGTSSTNATMWDVKGVGVYMIDSKRSILLANKIGNNDGSRTGIRAINSTVDILSNIISTKKEGIFYKDAINQDGIIVDNEISNCAYGISVSNCTPASKLHIDGNIITIVGSGGHRGISVDNSYPVLLSNATLNSNVITMQAGGPGIKMNNSTKWKISDNEITVNGAVPSIFNKDAAIELKDSHDNQLWRNTITGPGIAENYRGIFAFNSPNVLYCCNDLDETKFGLRFEGDCAGTTTIGTTQFNNHFNGLYYDPSGATGKQDYTGNEWNINCSGFDAFHAGGAVGAGQSIFTVDNSQVPFDANPSLNSNDWFIVEQNGTEHTCQNWSTCDEEEWLLPDINDNDVRVANGELEDLASGEVIQWLSEQRLYVKLRRDTQLMQGNALMQSFKQTKDTADIGLLHDIGESVSKLWNFSQQMSSVVQSQTQYLDSLSNIADSIVSALPGERQTENDALVLALGSTLSSLDAVMASYDSTLQVFKQARIAMIPSIEEAYDSLSLWFPPATNEQAVNTLQLDYWQNDSLTVNQIAALYAMAIECPLVGGNAVFYARGLFEAVTDTRKQWEYLEGCYGVNGRDSEGGREFLFSKNQSEGMVMYPNPTSGELTVTLFGDEGLSGNLSMFDLSGKCHVQKQPVTFGDNSVELGKLSTGLYIVTVITKDGFVFRQKLVVVK